MRALVLLGLFACGDSKVEVETPEDTGDVEDIGGDDTGADDTAEAPVGTPLTFVVDGEVEGGVLTLTWADVSDDFVVGDTVAAADVDGATVTVYAPDPTGDQLLELDPAAYPGTYVAWYLPAIHEDADGDGAHGADEAYVAHGTVLPLYIGGTLPEELADWGFVAGWNALAMGAEGATDFHDVDAIPLAVNLRPRETFTIAGDLADVDLDGDLRLTLVPGAVDEGRWPDDWLYDAPLDGAWSIDVAGAPPDDHRVDDGSGFGITYEIPLSYVDNDGSGGISAGDETAWPACYGDATASLVWISPPTTLDTAFLATIYGMGAGWSAVAWSADGTTTTVLDEQDAQTLVVGSGGCGLE